MEDQAMKAFDAWYLDYKDGKKIPDTMYEWLREAYREGMLRAAEICDAMQNQNDEDGLGFDPDDCAYSIRREAGE